MVDDDEMLRLLSRCSCQAVISRTDELTMVEHLHYFDCPELDWWRERQGGR